MLQGSSVLNRWTRLVEDLLDGPRLVEQSAAGGEQRLRAKLDAARSIRQARIRAGLTQQELAACFRITVAEMVAIEIGEGDCLLTLQMSERARRLAG